MRSVYFLIIFMFIGGVGFAQTITAEKGGDEKKLSDTLKYNGNVFYIVLPPKYSSKLFPKIWENKIALVNAKGEMQCLIRNYICGWDDHGRYRQSHITEASLEIMFNVFVPKDVQTISITDVNGQGEFGKENPIIMGFDMKRVK